MLVKTSGLGSLKYRGENLNRKCRQWAVESEGFDICGKE